MAYDLKHYIETMASDYADGDSQAIIDRYPWICSFEALVKSLDEAGVATGSVTQRNPNGYTAKEMAEKIMRSFDMTMQFDWSETTPYKPTCWSHVIDIYRWDQSQFWSNGSTYYISHAGHDGVIGSVAPVGGLTKEDIEDDILIILLPSTAYDVNTTEYKQKPFLGFDTEAHVGISGSGQEKIGTDDFGLELNVNGSNIVTGITTPLNGDDPSSAVTGEAYRAHPMMIYDFNYYHDDLNVNGTNFSVNAAYSGHNVIDTSTKWYDLAYAKFDVTISGGVVTAITAVSRNDGDGTAVTGGWGYGTQHDYKELYFVAGTALTYSTGDIAPRVLYRTNSAQSGYTGNKATVDITDADSEFYAGNVLVQSDFTTAYAVYGLGSFGYSQSPSFTYPNDQWYERNWPITINPASVRVTHERPVLQTQTRSLKTQTVATGAHRIRWEFNYPPMTRTEAEEYINKFEEFKGASQEIQINVPWTAMYHVEYWGAGKTKLAQRLVVTKGAKGDSSVTLNGHEPGGSDVIPTGTYMNLNHKTYKITGNSGTPDDYGRVTYGIEPPLLQSLVGHNTRTNKDSNDERKEYFKIKAVLEDDTLDYTVDAAGHYRLKFKFREAL